MIKKWIRFGAASILALTLCAVFGNILMAYYQPLEAAVYDLSMSWSGSEAVPDGWSYDQKDWTVFTQEGETVTELTPDGYGGFYGLDEPGQTFYFSRVLTEELTRPILRLDAADRTFSVFLDGALIYTDCPELDNRIGYLRLPTLDWYREEKLLITLPPNCAGKALTIAQSTSTYHDESLNPNMVVWPCDMTLYCGYAFESSLISESFHAAVPSALFYAAGLLLLGLFLWQTFRGHLNTGTLCGALAAFSYLGTRIHQTSFTHLYFDWTPFDIVWLCQILSLLTLLTMLLSKLSSWRRIVLGAMTAGLGAMALVDLILNVRQTANVSLTFWLFCLSSAALLLALVFGFREWNRQRWFFRCFCPITSAGIVVCVIPTVLCCNPVTRSPATFLWPLMGVSITAALLSAVAEWVQGELTRRTEAHLLVQRGELAQSSYEVLRQQNEQVMMLRHDMVKHFRLLRQTTGDEKTAAYLDELIGENERIQPVVQSGNEILDIILNGKLSAATDAGIAVKLGRIQAPDQLPLSDSELCSLMINLLDNAVEAAAAPGVQKRYIKLDMDIRNNFFVFICENGATLDWINKASEPEHGLGLKVIRKIMERYGNLFNAESGNDYYKVTVLLPLCQPPEKSVFVKKKVKQKGAKRESTHSTCKI